MAAVGSTHRKSSVGATELPAHLALAVRALAQGEPILIFDAPDREGETDMVLLAEKASPEKIALLRAEAGGFLCVSAPEELMQRLGIPYQQDLLRELGKEHPVLGRLVPDRLGYDRRSAFGLAISHRDTFTGIPDRDRALTIRALGEFVRDSAELDLATLSTRFSQQFFAPGHVPMLHSARGLLEERAGHTELSAALARMGGLTESVALMEMLSNDGGPLSPEAARRRATAKGWPFVLGAEIREAWSRWYG